MGIHSVISNSLTHTISDFMLVVGRCQDIARCVTQPFAYLVLETIILRHYSTHCNRLLKVSTC